VERDKEEDGLARLRWEKTREREAEGGACLTIKTGAELPIGPTYRFSCLHMTEGELVALLVSAQVMDQYRGTPFEADLRKALSKISGSLPDKIEGKTSEISLEQAHTLFAALVTSNINGLRDQAIPAMPKYTLCRAGAVPKLRLGDFQRDGQQYVLRFHEKGSKGVGFGQEVHNSFGPVGATCVVAARVVRGRLK
jgi:hypothetical protein